MGRRDHYRGGLGVRKRLSEESLRDSYRLNGVPTGSAVARCYDKYGRWELGYTLGVIVRKNSSVVQVRWADDPEEIVSYNPGDARYEVDRNRWKILGVVQGNPLDPENPIAVALTGLMGNEKMISKQMPPTEEHDMAERMSNAAAERAAAQGALRKGDLKERETYTAKQVAMRCGTDAKTMRKFFRSSFSSVEAVGQGGRYEFAATDMPKIKKEFNAWLNRSSVKRPKDAPEKLDPSDIAAAARRSAEEDPDFTMEQVAAAIERAQEQDEANFDDLDPTEEDLEEIADLDLDEEGDE